VDTPRHIDTEPDGAEIRRDYGPEMTPAWWHWQALHTGGFMRVLTGRPEPVVLANLVAGLISAAIVAAVALGWLPWSAEQQAAVMAVVVAAVNLAAAVWTRPQVTPVEDPRDANGGPLYSYKDALDAVKDEG
jgi:hypothetical protein